MHELVDFSLYHCDTIKNRRHACRLNLKARSAFNDGPSSAHLQIARFKSTMKILPELGLHVIMRGSGNFRQGGGEGPGQSVCFFVLVLSLLYRRQMVNFKEIIFQGARGVQHFPGGWGPTFSRGGGGGSIGLFPIETHITCDFQGGVRTPCPPPPLWIRFCVITERGIDFEHPLTKLSWSAHESGCKLWAGGRGHCTMRYWCIFQSFHEIPNLIFACHLLDWSGLIMFNPSIQLHGHTYVNANTHVRTTLRCK